MDTYFCQMILSGKECMTDRLRTVNGTCFVIHWTKQFFWYFLLVKLIIESMSRKIKELDPVGLPVHPTPGSANVPQVIRQNCCFYGRSAHYCETVLDDTAIWLYTTAVCRLVIYPVLLYRDRSYCHLTIHDNCLHLWQEEEIHSMCFFLSAVKQGSCHIWLANIREYSKICHLWSMFWTATCLKKSIFYAIP